MKKIIPALAMLLISAIVMSTASFAWFTMSKSVTAEGMSVKAQASSSLVIGWYDTTKYADNKFTGVTDDKWSNTATSTIGERVLAPASIANLDEWTEGTSSAANQKWFTGNAAASNSSAADGKGYTAINIPAWADVLTNNAADPLAAGVTSEWNNTAYLKTRYMVYDPGANNAAGNIPLYVTGVTIKGDNATDTTYKALRVAIVTKDAVLYTTANENGADSVTSYVTDAAASANTGASPTGAAGALLSASNHTIGNLTKDNSTRAGAYQIDVYIWFEGEDANCVTDKYVANGLDVTITFSTDSTDANTYTTSINPTN